jgi:hypothetical protein
VNKQTRGFQPTDEDNKFLADMKAAMPPNMADQRILAIASQFVGQLIALQDQRKITPDMAMQIVSENIEIGNRAALMTLTKPEGSA